MVGYVIFSGTSQFLSEFENKGMLQPVRFSSSFVHNFFSFFFLGGGGGGVKGGGKRRGKVAISLTNS